MDKDTLKHLGWYVAFVLLIIIIVMRECNSKHKCKPEYITETILKPSDTVYTTISRVVPKLVYRDTGSFKIAHSIDTVKVIKEHLTKNYYSDTIKGQDAEIVINDTLFRNKIAFRQVAVKNLRETKLLDVRKRALYLGASMGGNSNSFTALPQISYQNRKGSIFTYQYDIANKSHLIGYQIKIK